MNQTELLSKDKRVVKAGIAAVFCMVLLVSYFYDPVYYKITDCAFKEMSGLSCPGCGLSRSFHSVANMHMSDAFGFHLLGPVFFLILLAVIILYSYEAISGNIIKIVANKVLARIFVISIFVSWFIYWVARMVVEFW